MGVPCDFRLKYGAAFSSRTPLVSVNPSSEQLYKNRTPTLAVQASPVSFLVACVGRVFVCSPTVSQIRLADLLRGERIDRSQWFATLREREAERDAEIEQKMLRKPARDLNPLYLCQVHFFFRCSFRF